MSRALTVVDIAASSAKVAREFGYTRPDISTDLSLNVRNGRHAVVERSLMEGWFTTAGDNEWATTHASSTPTAAASEETQTRPEYTRTPPLQRMFVPNDVQLCGRPSDAQTATEATEAMLWLVTGANMGGKHGTRLCFIHHNSLPWPQGSQHCSVKRRNW